MTTTTPTKETTTMTTSDEVLTAITAGRCDDIIEELFEALKFRRSQKSASEFFDYSIGDAVVMVNGNPKYLNGAPGVVTGKGRTKINVILDQEWLVANLTPTQAMKWGGTITCPPSLLTRRDDR